MAAEIGMAVAPMIIEPVMKKVIRHVLYAFNLNKIVGELKQETVELKEAQERVERNVEEAKCNAEEIQKDVATWLVDVGKTIDEVESLEKDISEKKSCFNGLCPNLFARYRFGKHAMKNKDAITKLLAKGNFSRVSYFPIENLPGIEFYETKDFMPSASARSALEKIMKELKDDKKKIIALHGMGGVGKTTLAVQVGKKAEELKLVDKAIMAVVSRNLSIERIQGEIADMIGLHFGESSSMGRANRLRLGLEKMEKKVLIVLDDIWKKLDLASIGIPSGDDCTNIKVLLTTRRRQVCNSMGSQCNIRLDVLTDGNAWSLFNKRGGLSDNSSPLTVVAKSIADECKGLPLAIVTVASALKGKSLIEWEEALRRMGESQYMGIDEDDDDQDVYKCIRLSYDYLKNKEARLCFLLCSLFPEDYNIEVEVLVRYAYGLGLCQDVAASIESVRKVLHALITSLKDSSLLLSGRSDEFVKMHDIVRDVAVGISTEDKNNASMVRAGIGLEEWPEGKHYQSISRVSLMKNKIAKHCSGLVCQRLNLLLLDENGCYDFPDDFYVGMKELQVLSVCDRFHYFVAKSPFFSIPDSIRHLTNLCSLRIEWLQLNDISVLGKLEGLEILSLRGSQLEELPSAIGELNGLRVLDLSYCNRHQGMRIADKLFSKLSKLEELYIGIDGRDEGSCYAFLCDLMSLPKLSILSLKMANTKCLREGICFPKHLIRYHIKVGSMWKDPPTVTCWSKHLELKSIDAAKLNAFKEIIPGVNSLTLEDIKDDCIPNITPTIDQSGLHELTSLCLERCHSMECLLNTNDRKTTATAFSKLESIDLSYMDSLTELICGLLPDELFKELQSLTVNRCHKICTLVPAKFSRRLANLKQVSVSQCNEVNELFEFDLVRADVNENELLLSNLESLCLLRLPQLTRIWKGARDGVVSLVNLRSLDVHGCPKLTYVLSLSHAPCLPQLQVLKISNCNELKQIFQADEISYEPTQVWFPQLTELSLAELPKLANLRRLEVCGCSKLTYLFSLSHAPCLAQLQVLIISYCNDLKQIFHGDEISYEPTQVWFPQLTELSLRELPKFISYWRENYIPTSPEMLMPCLAKLGVEECPNMGAQFIADLQVLVKKLKKLKVEGPNWSRSCEIVVEQLTKGSRTSLQVLSITNVGPLLQPLTPGLVKVEDGLRIIGCKGIEEILEVGGQHSLPSTISWKKLTLENLPDLTCIWRGPSQSLSFHNLKWLSVSGCHGLKKHLLTTSIARSLLNLSRLMVHDCKELEQIFGDDETGDCDKTVTLPRLDQLRLSQLPKLISFCPPCYHFIFPSFREHLSVNDCPNNLTGFSRETDTKGFTTTTHAKGEAICSTENRGKCNDINDVNSLPLYEEDTRKVAETSDECPQRQHGIHQKIKVVLCAEKAEDGLTYPIIL